MTMTRLLLQASGGYCYFVETQEQRTRTSSGYKPRPASRTPRTAASVLHLPKRPGVQVRQDNSIASSLPSNSCWNLPITADYAISLFGLTSPRRSECELDKNCVSYVSAALR